MPHNFSFSCYFVEGPHGGGAWLSYSLRDESRYRIGQTESGEADTKYDTYWQAQINCQRFSLFRLRFVRGPDANGKYPAKQLVH